MTPAPSSTDFPLAELNTLRLDQEGSEPLYQQLADTIRNHILSGTWRPGYRLPATRKLAAMLGLGRNTVSAAYDLLTSEGLLESRVGAGCFVCSRLPDSAFRDTGPVAGEPQAGPIPSLSKRGVQLNASSSRAPVSQPRSFSPGIPDFEQFPIDLWARLQARHWRQATREMMTYADPAGYAPLREAIAGYLAACRGVRCEAEQVFVVSGSQQAIDLISRLLLDEGDAAWIEEPCYEGARGALRQAGARLVPVPVDGDGLNPQEGLKRCPDPKLMFLTPSHQYPMGRLMTMPRRLDVLATAHERGIWIVEDDYDSEFRFDGPPLPAIQGLDRRDSVLYLGTFSKVMFPALRIGYLVIPKRLIETFHKARSFVDSFTQPVNQAVLAEFIREGHFSSHLRRMRLCYRRRYEALGDLIQRHLANWFRVESQRGGMHVTLVAQEPFDDVAFYRDAAATGTVVRALSTYFTERPGRPGLILGYAGFPEAQLEAGVKRIAALLAQRSYHPVEVDSQRNPRMP
ncbi:PLP-dependent aminotransferase family protein [Sulfidibacter corallicola]|uniref:PLP-dependent aminotransferase family protein n=1 Tax=Sulfidibacter corallicola TaxID=2818388 RepID=A0A8A4TWE7_SULCO|nr:PLP-dependent aminotransferase family protein [Sulfidibacter corallicola]QTD53454.1 PLP-dependent aminotransferase family protein [Sulfidibacter corallicola]